MTDDVMNRIGKREQLWVLLIVLLVFTVLGWYSWRALQIRKLRVAAARAIVAWVYEGQPLPGSVYYAGIGWREGGYGYSFLNAEGRNRYVVCNFLPERVALSDRPAVKRISYEAAMAIMDRDGFGSGSFLYISELDSSSKRLKVLVVIAWAPLGGDNYEFTFEMHEGNLSAMGEQTGGS